MAILSLTNSEIVRAVLMTAGIGRNASSMDVATEADVRAIIRSGLLRAYTPVVGEYAYQWRWLEKHMDFPIETIYETGTIGVAAGTITLVTGTFPSWAADGFISVDGHVLFVAIRTSGAICTTTNTALAVTAGATYTLYRYRYPVPSDFAEWMGGLVYANGSTTRTLSQSTDAEIRLRYAIGQGQNFETTHYAITSTPDAANQRIVFWPVPQPDAFITGVYLSTPDDNLPVDLTVPGSIVQVRPVYAEMFLESILAAAEAYTGDRAGIHEARYQAAMLRAVAHDKASGGAYDFSNRLQDVQTRSNVLPIDFTDAL